MAFLEENSEQIDWWYKNGDNGRQNYAIDYRTPTGTPALFYVDFVIRLKNGKVMLFDTKSAGSDVVAHLKHNALVEYIAQENAKGANLVGGIIIEVGMNWLWSRFAIDNTTDHTGWDALDFRSENN